MSLKLGMMDLDANPAPHQHPMPETRQIISASGDGTVTIVFTQRKLPDGSWHNQRVRSATPEEIQTGTITTTMPSGSHNTHARLAPSGSKQWTNCTASIAFLEANRHRVPKEQDSPYAAEGTEAHDWAAKLLQGEIALLDVPSDFRLHVGEYVTHCLERVPDGVDPMVEVQVPLFYQPDAKGTCDFAVVTTDRVIIRDLKYGAGVLVKSFENTQLAIYGLSLIHHLQDLYGFRPDTVIDIAVYQPRHHEGADQEPWVTTLADLEIFCNSIGRKAELAMQGVERVRSVPRGDGSCEWVESVAPMTEFAPSEGDEGACRWCNAKAFCERRLAAITADIPHVDPKAMIAAMPDMSKEESKLPVEERLQVRADRMADHLPVDNEFLVAVFAASKNLTSYLSDVAEYLTALAHAGQAADGTKLVLGRAGNRAWANEEEADTFLKGQRLKLAERCDFKLKGPAKIETLLKDKFEKSARTRSRFEELVTRSDPKPVLATADDKRESVMAAVDMMPDEENFAI